MANKDTWPQIIEQDNPLAWRIKLRYFDGLTRVSYSGGVPYYSEVPGSYSYNGDDPWDETVDQITLDSQHPYVRQPVDVTRTVNVAKSSLLSEDVIADEYGPDATNPEPWTRKPLYQPSQDNRHDGRVWDRSGLEWANMRVELKTQAGQDPARGHNSYDEFMDNEKKFIKLKPKLAETAIDDDPHPRDPDPTQDKPLEYEVVIPAPVKFFLSSRELGSTSVAHYFHDNGATFGRGHSWLESREPSGIYYHSFDTSDVDNYKITAAPSYTADEVSGKVIGPGTWDVFLIPRRWAYYVRFSRIEEAAVEVVDVYPFGGDMDGPPTGQTPVCTAVADPDWGTPNLMHYVALELSPCAEKYGDPYYRVTESVSTSTKEATVVYQSQYGMLDVDTDYNACRYHQTIPDPNDTGHKYLNHDYEVAASIIGEEWHRTSTTRNGGTERLWNVCDCSDGSWSEQWIPAGETYCEQDITWAVTGTVTHSRYHQKHHHRVWLFWGRPPESALHWNYNTDTRPLRMVRWNWSETPNVDGDYELDGYDEHEIVMPGPRTQAEIQAEYDGSSMPFGDAWEALCGDTCNTLHTARNSSRWAMTNYGVDTASKVAQVWDPGTHRSMPDHGPAGWDWYDDGSPTYYHLRPFRHMFPDEEPTSMGNLSLQPFYHILFEPIEYMGPRPALQENFYEAILRSHLDTLSAECRALYPQPSPPNVEDPNYSNDAARRLEAMSTSGRQPFGVGLSPSLEGQLCAVLRRGGQRYFVWRRTDEQIEEIKIGSGHGFLGFEADATNGNANKFRAHVLQHRRDRPEDSGRWDSDYGNYVYGVLDDDTGQHIYDWYKGYDQYRVPWTRIAWCQPDITFAYPLTGDATGREHTHVYEGMTVGNHGGPVPYIGGYHSAQMTGTAQGDALPASVFPMISREWYGTTGVLCGWKWNGSQYVDVNSLSYSEAAAIGDNGAVANRRGRNWLPLTMDGNSYEVDEGDW